MNFSKTMNCTCSLGLFNIFVLENLIVLVNITFLLLPILTGLSNWQSRKFLLSLPTHHSQKKRKEEMHLTVFYNIPSYFQSFISNKWDFFQNNIVPYPFPRHSL